MAPNKKKKSKGNVKNRPEFKSNYIILTINLPEPVLDRIDSLLGVLYQSRSQAIRYYCMRQLEADLEFIHKMEGDFTTKETVLFEEGGEQYFVDEKGVIWFVGRAHENVGRAIQNV